MGISEQSLQTTRELELACNSVFYRVDAKKITEKDINRCAATNPGRGIICGLILDGDLDSCTCAYNDCHPVMDDLCAGKSQNACASTTQKAADGNTYKCHW